MAPVFFFSRQRPLPLPFFAFPYHSNLEVLLQGRLLACPGTGRAVSFASGVFRAAAGGQEKIPNFEKIITDAIAFPPPMTHNGVWFSGNKSKAPCQTSSRYWFLPAGGIPGGFHHGAPKQEAETAPTCRVISQCDAPWVWRTPEQDRDGKRGNESKRRRAGDRCWPGCRQNAPVLAASNRPRKGGILSDILLNVCWYQISICATFKRRKQV